MIIQYDKISNFDQEGTIQSFSKNDLLVKSSKLDSEQYNSYAVDCGTVYEAYKDGIEDQQNFVLDGEWVVDGVFRNNIENIPDLNTSDQAISSSVTLEWCQQNLLSRLAELSAKLYGDQDTPRKIPSYVGQIIISNTLDTEEKVSEVYDGTWKKIEGRFLLGVGANSVNTNSEFGSCFAGDLNVSRAGKLGGAKTVSLGSNNVPGHSHKIQEMSFGQLPAKTIGMELHHSGTGVYGVIGDGAGEHFPEVVYHQNNKKHHGGSNHWFAGHTGGDSGNYGDPTTLRSIDEITGSGDISRTFVFTPKGTITDSCGIQDSTAKPHNNIPDYVAKHIWERIK